MKYRPRKFDDSFKRRIVHEYLTTDLSQKELHAKYGIIGHHQLSRWCKKFEHESLTEVSAKRGNLEGMKPTDNKKLVERIKELESALKEAEVRAIAYQRLVENVEKELGISLPKKFSTKQSKK